MKKITQLLACITFVLLMLQSVYSQTEYQLDSIERFDWNGTAFDMNNRDLFYI